MAGIDNTNTPLVADLFERLVSIKHHSNLVWRMAIAVDQERDQVRASDGQALLTHSLKRRRPFNDIIPIDQDIASHGPVSSSFPSLSQVKRSS